MVYFSFYIMNFPPASTEQQAEPTTEPNPQENLTWAMPLTEMGTPREV